MTQDEIIEMARQAGFDWSGKDLTWEGVICTEELEAFAKLVADKKVEGMVMMTPEEFKSVWDKAQAEEREACAEIAESKRHAPHFVLTSMPSQNGTAVDIANLIRARGQA
jgi:hypothetical protein